MDTEKIESLIHRVINKHFPFVGGVRFSGDKYGDPICILYIDSNGVIERYDKDTKHINHPSPYKDHLQHDFLHYMFTINKDWSCFTQEEYKFHNEFENISTNLDDLAYHLASPFSTLLCKNSGLNSSDDILIQYETL
jgi:hypothetical protein